MTSDDVRRLVLFPNFNFSDFFLLIKRSLAVKMSFADRRNQLFDDEDEEVILSPEMEKRLFGDEEPIVLFPEMKKPLFDDDDETDEFWFSSNKWKNLFEEDDAVGPEGDNDDVEVVNWSGELVSSSALSAQSARYRYPISDKQKKKKPEHKTSSLGRSGKYEEEKEMKELAKTLAGAILKEEEPEDFIDKPTKNISKSKLGDATERAKLQSDLNSYKRKLAAAESSRWTSLPVEETVKRMLTGQVYTLETYKSLNEKLALLDAAVDCGDGDALTAAVVFFHKTVKTNLFLAEIQSRPAARDHYLQYLRQTSRTSDLIETLGMFGFNEEAAILKFGQATKMKNPQQKVRALKSCLQAHYLSDPFLAKDAALIQQQIQLLEVQQPIDQSDAEVAAKAKETLLRLRAEQQSSPPLPEPNLPPELEIFARIPRPSSLIDLPLLTSLNYCVTYHYGEPVSCFGSPEFLRKTFGLSQKQHAWVALRAHARLKRWTEVDKLLKTKSFFGKEKRKVDLDFKTVASILSKQGAESRMVASYLLEVNDVGDRLATAIKIGCHLAAVDAFATERDRLGLIDYARKLKPENAIHADLLLKNPNIKWKN